MATTRKPRKPRLTRAEKAAQWMCADFRAKYEPGDGPLIVVKWAKSRTWGKCPRITYQGETVAHASGCGYDKLSTVLANALQYLGRSDDERRAIASTYGAGVSSVKAALLRNGWDLREGYCDSDTDVYSLIYVGSKSTEPGQTAP